MFYKLSHRDQSTNSLIHQSTNVLIIQSSNSLMNQLTNLLIHKIPLHLSRELYKSTLFMQNKPNLKNAQIYISACNRSGYDVFRLIFRRKNKAKRTQNEPNFSPKLALFFPKLALFYKVIFAFAKELNLRKSVVERIKKDASTNCQSAGIIKGNGFLTNNSGFILRWVRQKKKTVNSRRLSR